MCPHAQVASELLLSQGHHFGAGAHGEMIGFWVTRVAFWGK